MSRIQLNESSGSANFDRVFAKIKKNPYLGWAILKRPADIRRRNWQILVYLDIGDVGWFNHNDVIQLFKKSPLERAFRNKQIEPEQRKYNYLQIKALVELRKYGKDWPGLDMTKLDIGQALWLDNIPNDSDGEKNEENLVRVEEIFDLGFRISSKRKNFKIHLFHFFQFQFYII